MSTTYTFSPDCVFPPGETLLETLEALGLTQKELAARMGRPLKTINQIIKGTAQIMPETALQLEKVTGVPASFWNNAESNYRAYLARVKDEERQQEDVGWVKRFSYTKMASLKFVTEVQDPTARVGQLLRYFGVASSAQWESTYGELCGSARESAKFQSDLGDLSAWLRAGELLAQKKDCKPYDKETFTRNLKLIRSLTAQNPAKVWPEVSHLCAEAGVAVVLVPELPETHVSGFTRWLTPEKALIQLSLRYKTDDVMWFTFFHEAAHILLHGKRDIFVEYRKVEDNPKEREANAWAGEFLIPEAEWKAFVQSLPSKPTLNSITSFARKLSIAPGIVLGRLQHRENFCRLLSSITSSTCWRLNGMAWNKHQSTHSLDT
ncbi:MAG: ImmA/IrrE family metallo-endopeptidase [Akkermansiaceae bacterium]|nr:ImmA/IrrE family metallo-endopeptidase [Akkermansiaceae bacterium]